MILELSSQEFKITTIRMLRALIGKTDNMKNLQVNVSREMETLRKKKQKKILETKNTVK